jgi:arylsulfatase A-like enzyme
MPALQDFGDQVLAHLDRLADAERALLRIDGPLLAPPWPLSREFLGSYFDEVEDILPEPWPDPPQGRITLADDDLLRVQNTYAAVVTAWDAQLERILNGLAKQPWAEDLILIVTARSGLPLGEHGQIGFAHPWLHEELVHVPLLIRFPERRHAGRRIAALTGSRDLTDALNAWQGLATNQEPRLLQLLQNGREPQNGEIMSRWRLGQEEEWSARTAEWALIWPQTSTDRPVQLYAKPDDRWEVNNVAHQHHELVEQWQRRLEKAMSNLER